MSYKIKPASKQSFLPGQLVLAHNVWNVKNMTYITYGPEAAILCMFISSHYEINGYHDCDILLYKDELVHAYPHSIKVYEEL